MDLKRIQPTTSNLSRNLAFDLNTTITIFILDLGRTEPITSTPPRWANYLPTELLHTTVTKFIMDLGRIEHTHWATKYHCLKIHYESWQNWTHNLLVTEQTIYPLSYKIQLFKNSLWTFAGMNLPLTEPFSHYGT